MHCLQRSCFKYFLVGKGQCADCVKIPCKQVSTMLSLSWTLSNYLILCLIVFILFEKFKAHFYSVILSKKMYYRQFFILIAMAVAVDCSNVCVQKYKISLRYKYNILHAVHIKIQANDLLYV